MPSSAYRFRRALLLPALGCCAVLLLLQLSAAIPPRYAAKWQSYLPALAAPSEAEESPQGQGVPGNTSKSEEMPAATGTSGKSDKKIEGAAQKPDEAEKAKDEAAQKEEAKPLPGDPVRADLSGGDPAERALLQNLAKRRKELEDWSASVALKENILNAGEQKLNLKLQQLGKLKDELKSILEEYRAKEDAKTTRLVKIYENMPPKDAARIFDAMEDETLLEVLDKMKETKAAPVLAAMQTERVSILTRRLMERRRAGTAKAEQAEQSSAPEGPSSALPPPAPFTPAAPTSGAAP